MLTAMQSLARALEETPVAPDVTHSRDGASPPLSCPAALPIGLRLTGNFETEAARLSRLLGVEAWGSPLASTPLSVCPLGTGCPANLAALCKLHHPTDRPEAVRSLTHIRAYCACLSTTHKDKTVLRKAISYRDLVGLPRAPRELRS